MRPSRRWTDSGGRRARPWRHALRRGARAAGDDTGSASLEFITTGLILLLPMVYLVLVMAAVQGGALAVEGAARHASRVYVIADDERDARAAARRAVEFALDDHGLPASDARVGIGCSPRPDACLTRAGIVTVAVRVEVPLPLVPQALDLAVPLSIPLEAAATQQVSRFRAEL